MTTESMVVQPNTIIDPVLINNLQKDLSATGTGVGSGSSLTPGQKRDNTIKAVTDLLVGLLDSDSKEAIISQLKGQGGDAVDVGGVGKSGKGNNKFLPSFNIRTPLVEISINNVQIYPKKWNIDQKKYVNARMNFKDFKLSLPLGGVEKSIRGSMTLFTKNPREILDAVGPIGIGGMSGGKDSGVDPTSGFATGGLPTMTLKFGWAFSDSTEMSTISKSMSPVLNLLVTNISMTDPGTAGTTFTFALQELGTMILEHSTDSIVLLSDYPQQQLRAILEGILHARLFTLDDLFYFDQNNTSLYSSAQQTAPNPNDTSTPASPSPASSTPPLLEAALIANIRTQLEDLGLQGWQLNADQLQAIFLKLQPVFKRAGLEGGWKLNAEEVQILFQKVGEVKPKTADQLTAQQTVPSESASVQKGVVGTGATNTTGQTFFATGKSGAISINGKNFFTVAQELASLCRCKWYPHKNEDATADETDSNKAMTELGSLANDLKLVKTLGDILTKEDIDALKQSDSNLSPIIVAGMGNSMVQDILMSQLKAATSRLSTKSILFWIPNIPGTWQTSGSRYYSDNIPYEDGAFFLLPDILDDYDIFLADLPVQYGPGASALPYFYGSGQNVFQTAIGNTGSNIPKLFGEVISLAVTHSSLIVALSQSANENMAYGVIGERFGQLAAPQKYKAKSAGKTTVKTKADLTFDPALQKQQEERINNAETKIKTTAMSIFRSRRFNGSLALGGKGALSLYDSAKTSAEAKTRPEADATPAQSSSYAIKTRVANFLRYPTQAKITILGDPNLIRLGPGCFELFSYYPVEHDDGSVTQELNALTSGVYFVEKIEHSITGEHFVTTMSGSKIVDPVNVPSSVTNKILSQLNAENAASKTEAAKLAADEFGGIVEAANSLNQFNTLDLNSPASDLFITGSFASDLRTVFEEYRNPAIVNPFITTAL